MDGLPDDLFHEIIKLINPCYYFNIYCLSCRFRKCLKYVYDHNSRLKTNQDILTSLVYKNLIYNSNNIISLSEYVYYISSRFQFGVYASSLARAVLQFNVVYEADALDKILSAACCYHDLQIIKHIEKLNTITNHCFNRLKGLDEDTEIFNYLFEHLLKYGNNNDLTRMAERTYSNNQTDLFKKVVKTGRIQYANNLISQLLIYDKVELISLLLSSNKIIITNKQRRSFRYGSDDMKTLIKTYI